MGGFNGHALPGSFFLLFGIYWTIQITRRFVMCKFKGIPYYNTSIYPISYSRIKLPIDGIVKVVITSIGIFVEGLAATLPIRSGRPDDMEDFHGYYITDIQHISMYFFFLLSGIVDILVDSSLVPVGLDYIMLSLAFSVEGMLFLFHLNKEDPLDYTLHTLLLYSILGCIISCILEHKYKRSILVAVFKAYFTCIQGTWFWQIGFILYRMEPWDKARHENTMLCTVIFTWHMAGAMLLMGIVAGITYLLLTGVCRTGNINGNDQELTHFRVGNKYKYIQQKNNSDEERGLESKSLLNED